MGKKNKDWLGATIGLSAFGFGSIVPGKAILGEGRAELLDAIGRHRSITAAAKIVGISYRKAWNMIQEINAAAGDPLVESAVGGVKGGGAQLTERGQFAVSVYQQIHQALHESAGEVLRRIVGSDRAATACVHLAAAISLQEVVGQLLSELVVGQLLSEFALRQPAIHVRVVYGASNELADHLLAGAPGDLFLSAEPRQLDRLDEAQRLLPRSRRLIASNGLTVIGPPKATPLKKLSELRGKNIRRIALAEPDCPLGGYSQARLKSAGLYDAIQSKILHVDNSRAVLSAVAAGTADVGIAFTQRCRAIGTLPHLVSNSSLPGGGYLCRWHHSRWLANGQRPKRSSISSPRQPPLNISAATACNQSKPEL